MEVITAPDLYGGIKPSIFLAGGITDAPDWQSDIIKELQDLDIVLFNPRRGYMPEGEAMVREQIEWEHLHLRKATAIIFWFPAKVICPIALFELGAWLTVPWHVKKLVIGVDPLYLRRFDVIEQTRLVRPDIQIRLGYNDFESGVRALAGILSNTGPIDRMGALR